MAINSHNQNRIKKSRKCFTLIEVIIATTIFSIVSMIAITVFIDIVRIQKRIYLENAIYEDGRFLMERISRAIRQNAIDYEEYHNKRTQLGKYGQYYGCYASRFYNPGTGGIGVSKLGALCTSPAAAAGNDVKLHPGCVVDKKSLDINTGQNPYTGLYPLKARDTANAFCNENIAVACPDAKVFPLRDQSQLYLINAKGTQKTIFALKNYNTAPLERALSMIKIDGHDTENDSIMETWYTAAPTQDFHCAAGYDCPAALAGLEDTLTDPAKLWQGFIAISPMRTNVKSIHFYISPVEDPRKAFAETAAADGIQQQPHVTVTMTLTPSQSALSNFGGTAPTITLQSTISSRVYNEVKSFNSLGLCSNYI